MEVLENNMELSRRCYINKFCPAEKAIWEVIQEVEKLTGSIELTKAVNLLMEAKDIVADFEDERLKKEGEINV